jgi:hypothetical protein
MTCPLCGQRRARRACPALGHDICPVCCATKRQVEIRCPAGCPHLVAGKAHPSAVARRQQEADLRLLMDGAGRLTEGQLQLFFLIHSYFLRPAPPGQPRVSDAEVADGAAALAGTFETASRGLIFEHQAATPGGGRIAAELLPVLQEAGKGGGSRFEREVAAVLRAVERGARAASGPPSDSRAYLERVARVLGEGGPAAEPEPAPRIVLP